MSDVDLLLRRYIAEHRAAGDADPAPYLDQVSGADRAELAALIDRFLAEAPPPAFDAAAFKRFRADPRWQPVAERLLDDVTLVDLRRQAKLTKADIGATLADALALPGHVAAVKARYHDLECGSVDPGRVRDRVWAALGQLLGAPAERVSHAAETTFAAVAPGRERAVFARSVKAPAAAAPVPAKPRARDDAVVDRAFFVD